MNGGQDLGGVHGFGPVTPEPVNPVFHANWEKRVFAMTLAMGALGRWNIDQSRSARESIPPSRYLTSTYYQIWLYGLQRLILDSGLASESEFSVGQAIDSAVAVKPLAREDVAAAMSKGGPVERAVATPAAFKVGDRVQVRNMHPTGHTRVPRYIRGHFGTIHAIHGGHVYPDSNALGNEDPQWMYSVRFDAFELWGKDTTADAVFVDCWEPYLMATGQTQLEQ